MVTQQVVLCLREDGGTVPEGVSKWADESNWMGGDAVVLTADTAEVRRYMHDTPWHHDQNPHSARCTRETCR